MSIENVYAPVKLSGNGVEDTFAFDFRIYAKGDIKVSWVDKDTDEVVAVKALGTDYDVVINPITSEGGEVVFEPTDIPDSDTWVLMESNIANTQPTGFGVDSKLSEKSFEKGLDRQTRLIQQTAEQVTRSVKIPASLADAGLELTLPVPEAGALFGWNATADALVNATPNTDAYLTKASQPQAEAGTENTTYMTPLRVAQAITALTPAAAPVTLTNSVTLTNKRITKRVGTVASSGTPTINTDSYDMYTITALAAAITSFTTNLSGTPTTGQQLIIRIKDDGTARAITWGASFASRGGTLPTTTVISKTTYVGLIWNEVASTWDCIATCTEA